jgi:hypothetical protein
MSNRGTSTSEVLDSIHLPKEFQIEYDIWTFQNFGGIKIALKKLNRLFDSKSCTHLIYDLKDQEIAFEFKLEVWNSQPWDHIKKFIINK